MPWPPRSPDITPSWPVTFRAPLPFQRPAWSVTFIAPLPVQPGPLHS
jgi:hypothetical protein